MRYTIEELKDYRRKYQTYERVKQVWEYRYTVEPNDTVYYGDIQEDEAGKYIELPYCTYSDYSGSTVEHANCDYFLDQFGEHEHVHEIYGRFGTRGVLIHESFLHADISDSGESDYILELILGLFEYPLFEDESLSGLEFELEQESWNTWVKSDLEYQLEKNDIEFNPDTLENDFWDIIREHDIEFIHEDAISPYIDIDKVIEHWTQ